MQQALVTGGAGFIGSHLVERLLAEGMRVRVVDNETTGSPSNLDGAREREEFEYIRGDCGDAAMLSAAMEGVDVVYHLAAAVGVALVADDPFTTIRTNIHPTDVLLAELRSRAAAGQRIKLFFSSTSEVYGKNPKARWSEDDDLVFGPTTRFRWAYGASKAIDEFLVLAAVRRDGLHAVIGRFFNVIGPRQVGAYGMVVPRFVDAALAGRPLLVHGDGRQSRCFAHVADVVSAVLDLMKTPAAEGEIFNIGDGHPITILELARKVIAATDSSSSIKFQPYEEAFSAGFEDVRSRAPNLHRLVSLINYLPRFDHDAAIADVVAWRRAQRGSA